MMGRAGVSVRLVDSSLHSMFIELWITHRVEGGTSPEAAQRLALDGTLRTALERDDIYAFLAFAGERPAGYVVLSDSTRSLIVTTPCVSIDMLYVRPDLRRQGVAHALLSAAARYADRAGAEHLISSVPAADREANRFFARLGFAAETVRRVVTSATLQRKLAGEDRTRRVGLDQVLQRRRERRDVRDVTGAQGGHGSRHPGPQIAG